MKTFFRWVCPLVLIGLSLSIWKIIQKQEEDATLDKLPERLALKLRTDEQKMGDDFLASYASEQSSDDEDIRLFYDYLMNVFLLLKNRDSAEYAINEDLSKFLRGNNREKMVFVSEDSPIFDEKKRIVDRWGTPIHIHTISHHHFELRSGGPDGKLFTEDDLAWPIR